MGFGRKQEKPMVNENAGGAGQNKGQAERKKKEDRVGFGTVMLWQSRTVSTTIVTLLYGFLMIYCTDTLKVNAALVAGMLMASKAVDGVTDAFAGFIVDRTKTKWGKARPYEVFILGLWLCTWLLFSTPVAWSQMLKAVWIFVMYCLANAICTTFLNADNTVYLVRAFHEKQIVKLTSYGAVVPMLTGLVFNIAFPGLMARIATSPAGWSRLVGMFAVPFAAIGLLRLFVFPEKYDVDAQAGQTEQVKLKDIVTCVRTNNYILILAFMTLVFNFVCNMGVNVYYFRYIVGNVGLMGVTAAAQAVVIPLAFLFPRLIDKFSTARLMTVGFLIAAAGYLLNFFAGSNIVLLLIAAILTGGGTVPASMLAALIIIECADYNEWNHHPRMEGTMSSINGLAGKIGAAVGTGILGVLLTASGFTGDAATTPQSSLVMIRMLFSLIPMALYILTSLTLRQYKLPEQLPQIREDIKERRAARNTAKTGAD